MNRLRSQIQNTEDTTIDITPMLDVVFILLIFFIVTATFVKEQGIDSNRPDTSPTTHIDSTTAILIEIGASNHVTIDHRGTDIRRVGANIRRLRAERPHAPVVIKPHPNAHTNTLVNVMDASRTAGVFNIALVN